MQVNFNDPLELTTLFRHKNEVTNEITEYQHKIYVLWEDIKAIEESPYADNWEAQGEKYYLLLYGEEQSPRVILGSLHDMVNTWMYFRRTNPLFNREE